MQQAFSQFIEAHPTFFGFIMFPTLTAIINIAVQDLGQRFPRFIDALLGAGFDPSKFFGAFKK